MVVTLVERDFLYGAAVLFNSLWSGGFRGRFVIGYRDLDQLPQGLRRKIENASHTLGIKFIPVNTQDHLSNHKAEFMQRVISEMPLLQTITYIDPDVVSLCPWDWMESWNSAGVTLCADVNWCLPDSHPTRLSWRKIMNENGNCAHRAQDVYFNGGFLSLKKQHEEFLGLWSKYTRVAVKGNAYIPRSGDIASWRNGGRENCFETPDQDALNIAATAWKGGLVTLGPDAMGFAPGIKILPHSIGPKKPWRRKYLSDALLSACPPSLADKSFWRHASEPIAISPGIQIQLKKAAVIVASAIGRFYRRS